MKAKFFSPILKSVRTVLYLLVILPGLLGSYPIQAAPIAGVQAAPATIITVNSGTDLDTSLSKTCISDTPCTLRRAVVQARTATKPVLIQFNIPEDAAKGWVSSLHIWKINLLSTALRYIEGDTTIDGSTQPNGRASGPKIFLVGAGTGQNDGLKLGATGAQNNNVIRGIGFQNFDTHIYVNSGSNLLENNWFGLSDNGTGIVLRGGGASDGSGNTGISVGVNVTNNIIQNNVFAGLAGVAAAINGDHTTFAHNYVGTTASGTVPAKQTDPSLICTPVDWLGGSGLSLSGSYNLVDSNTIAGIRIAVVSISTQADSIRMGGDHHTISNNKIGLDSANAQIGVCGRGIFIQGGSKFDQITSNQIVAPGLSAISLNDSPSVSTTDGNTLRGNVIKKFTPWGGTSPNFEDAIQVTQNFPVAYRNFKPAKITSINGVTVTGTSGTGSPCPNCVVEIFLEDRDDITETLQSLKVVTADASGNWTATLTAALTNTQGLRTLSTTAAYNTIAGKSAGTTTRLSDLYLSDKRIYLPLLTR
jgi:hypothetical protein